MDSLASDGETPEGGRAQGPEHPRLARNAARWGDADAQAAAMRPGRGIVPGSN